MHSSNASLLPFLAGKEEMAALMRAHDWSQSPLGPPEAWPQSLRSVVSLLLRSKFPMFVAWGPELGFLYNDGYAQILGAKHPAALGRRFREIWAEIWDDIYPIIEQAMQGVASYHENLPLIVNRKGHDEQAWFTFSYSPAIDEDGKVAGMFCAVTETTEQVLAARHRVVELARLRHLFQQAPGIIAVLKEPDHVFEIANDAYLQLVGHRDILGKSVREALPEVAGQGFFELLDRVYKTGEPYVGREVAVKLHRSPSGPLEERFVNFVYQPIYDHRGQITGIFVEGSDVTQAVKAHQALRESENELKAANRRKDEFLAMLAHELRNPLAPIATAAALLERTASDEEQVRKTSQVIARQVAHMTELVDDLLDVSRVTRGLVPLQEETLNIGPLLVDAVEQVRPSMDAKAQQFDADMHDEQLWVRGDRTRLVQVFSNILHNASKYTPPGGRIWLRVQGDEAQVTVAVEDTGIGIAPALLPDIFGLFTQAERSPDRAQGGLGLGLALVKSLVELQNGEVWADSAGVGKGSSFFVRLPRINAPQSDTEMLEEAPIPRPAAKTRVLVVDDNRDAAELLKLSLEAEGHEAHMAFSAHDALAIASKISPNVLLLDIGLPDLDGYELARRLRALPQASKAMLVALTGYGQPQDKQLAREAGFDEHLVKPVLFDEVLGLLSRAEPRP